MSGPELARRLEVSARSVRRYVAQLRDMGIPVEAERDRFGRYRLRPGYKLPPLMFTDDEALVLTLGLLLARRSGALVEAVAAEGALAKLDRVEGAELLAATFSPPEDFDTLEYVNRALATMPDRFSADVLLKTTLEEARCFVPSAMATLEAVPEGVVMRCTTGHLEWLARVLAGFPCALQIRQPLELKAALEKHVAGMLAQLRS